MNIETLTALGNTRFELRKLAKQCLDAGDKYKMDGNEEGYKYQLAYSDGIEYAMRCIEHQMIVLFDAE